MPKRSAPTAARLAAAALLALPLVATPAVADTTFSLNGDVVSPPASTGPTEVFGGVGSTGWVFGAIDRGRFRSSCSCSNPVTGLFTPQVDAPMRMTVTATDVHVIAADPNYDPQGITLTMHMLVTGDLANSGPAPYEADLTARVYGSGFDDNGTAMLGAGTYSTAGPLAGAPQHLVDYPVDFPMLMLASPSNTQFIVIIVATRAYGTGIGTDVNTAVADFGGQGLRFPTLTPAFDAPPGIAVSIPSLNIVNNWWTDPTAGVAPPARSHGLALAVRRNPVRGRATFALALPADAGARVEILDVTGRLVATLLEGRTSAGEHELTWDAGANPAGVYFARVTSGGAQATTRVVLVP